MNRLVAHTLPEGCFRFGVEGLGHRGLEQMERHLGMKATVLEGTLFGRRVVSFLQGLPCVSCARTVGRDDGVVSQVVVVK